jgi:hypothetical protein
MNWQHSPVFQGFGANRVPKSRESNGKYGPRDVYRAFFERGRRCIHRHDYFTKLSSLLCSRIRQSLDHDQTGELSNEQVRRCLNASLQNYRLPVDLRDEAFEKDPEEQSDRQHCIAQAIKSHIYTQIRLDPHLGIDTIETSPTSPRSHKTP